MAQKIQIKRSEAVYRTKELAITALNSLVLAYGEPVILRYLEGDLTKIIFAIGTSENSYKIINSSEDLPQIISSLNTLSDAFGNHELTKAGDELGHVKTGGDLEFTDGEGTIKEGVELKDPKIIMSEEPSDNSAVNVSYINTRLSNISTGMSYKGTLSSFSVLPQANPGDLYYASGSGILGGTDITVTSGDIFICKLRTVEKEYDPDFWDYIPSSSSGILGPSQTTENFIPLWGDSEGNTLKSGISVGSLAQASTSVSAGEGLSGGGTLGTGATISLATVSVENTKNAPLVSGITVDSYGRVSSVSYSYGTTEIDGGTF